MSGAEVTGFPRPGGAAGVRNHVLVLPSVVCSSHAAHEIARDTRAKVITHQHGCLHVGDDLRHTEHELIGTATNPNVGAAVVVGLGCETIQGRRLATRIAQLGQRVTFVGIQMEGGTARAIERGREALAELFATLDDEPREAVAPERLLVGIDAPRDPVVGPLRDRLSELGVGSVTAEEVEGAASHVALASRGAQVIVSLRGPGEGPTGFAVCPVVAVSRDEKLFAALRDDFDLDAGDDEASLPGRIADAVLAVAAGDATASEHRGARDFVLHRLAVTM